MSLLRRLLGDDAGSRGGMAPSKGTEPPPAEKAQDAIEAERLHEREVLMAENERLDELKRRQLKYADRAWTPPKQGGERRADDADRPEG